MSVQGQVLAVSYRPCLWVGGRELGGSWMWTTLAACPPPFVILFRASPFFLSVGGLPGVPGGLPLGRKLPVPISLLSPSLGGSWWCALLQVSKLRV